jgi:succinate dehydrogenase / fumarate reductase membrane anchor subunit
VSLRSALGRAQGQGAAHSGVHHWWMQRLTALALLPLTVWLAASLVALPAYSYEAVHAWMRQSVSALLLILLVLVAAWHSRLGVQEVIEDYVHDRGAKTLALILSVFVHVLLAVVGVFAILKVSFGAAS